MRCSFLGWRGVELFNNSLQQDVKVICNLSSGGTNPYVIAEMIEFGVSTRQLDRLHAKVYIGNGHAIVSSANASANGLGLENTEQSHWYETGVHLNNIKVVSEWFDKLWIQSNEISSIDIKVAIEKWRLRRANRPTVSFADFKIDPGQSPLINWSGNEDWEVCEGNVKRQLGYYNNLVEKRIDYGIEIEAEEDIALLKPGTWVLNWQRTRRGYPNNRVKPWWVCLGPIVRDGFVYLNDKSKPLSVALEAEHSPPVPFNASDPIFIKALREVISEDIYLDLRTDDYTGAWFAPRTQLMGKLWVDLKLKYRKLANES